MSIPIALPGSYTYDEVISVAIAIRESGSAVNDPDCWEHPEDSADGNWHLLTW